MYDTIVVGTDGSDKAAQAVDRALAIASRNDAEVYAITVVNTARYGEPALSSTEIVLDELEDRGTEQLREIERKGEKRDVSIVTDCFHGEPSEEILEYAEDVGADLIVLGSHGRTHPRALLGSTADRVLQNTDREVLIV